MIECLPTGICSWNYVLRGEGHKARLDFFWSNEQGKIVVDGAEFGIRKHGFMSGRWSMNLRGEVFAEAKKPSSMSRTFYVSSPGGQLFLEADSWSSRTFGLHASGVRKATLRPMHLFTRRAVIQRTSTMTAEQGGDPDFATLCFCFWLTALMWKRQAEADAS